MPLGMPSGGPNYAINLDELHIFLKKKMQKMRKQEKEGGAGGGGEREELGCEPQAPHPSRSPLPLPTFPLPRSRLMTTMLDVLPFRVYARKA